MIMTNVFNILCFQFIFLWICFCNWNFYTFHITQTVSNVLYSLDIMGSIQINSSAMPASCSLTVTLVLFPLWLIKIVLNKCHPFFLYNMIFPYKITIARIAPFIVWLFVSIFNIWKISFNLLANIFYNWQCLCKILLAPLQKCKIKIFLNSIILFYVNHIHMMAHSFFPKIILLRFPKIL